MSKKNTKAFNFVSKIIKNNPNAGYSKFAENHPYSTISEATFYKWKSDVLKQSKSDVKKDRPVPRSYSFKINLQNSLSSEELKLVEKIRTLPDSEQKVCFENLAKIYFLRNGIEGMVGSYKIVQQLTQQQRKS
jgi:hypothetical protein